MTKLPSRIHIGDRCSSENMPDLALEVIDISDPALIVLRTPNGAMLKAGRKTVIRVETQGTDQATRRPPMAG